MYFSRLVESPKWMLGSLVISLVIIYGPSLNNAFVSLDDDLLIYKNPIVQGMTGPNMKAAFTRYDPELYIPLTFLSYQFDYTLGGYQPFIYHFTNLLLHTANALLVGGLTFLLTSKRGVAFFCAVLFAVHPIHVETVAWAAARKDVLSTFFFLISFGLWLLQKEHQSTKLYWTSMTCFALGLMAKVSVIMLPVLLLAHRSLGEGGSRITKPTKAELITLLPYFGLSILFGIVALFGKQRLLVSTTLVEKILMAGKSTTTYIWHLLAPFNLSVLYPQSDPIGFTAEFLLPLIIVTLIVAVMIGLLRRRPLLSFAVAWFLITLVPTFTNFSKNGFLYFASDRYAYIPSIGFFLVIALVIAELLDSKPVLWQKAKLLTGVAGALVLILVALSMKQAQRWQGNEVLFTHVISIYPTAAVAWNNLGVVHFDREELDTAMEHFQQAATLGPNFIEAHANIGNVHNQRGDRQQAIAAYSQAVAAIPDTNLTADDLIPYYYLAEMYDTAGQRSKAVEQLEAAISRGSEFPEPHHNLALKYQKYQRLDDALVEYEAAVAADSTYIHARYNAAAILARRGRIPEAIAHLEVIERRDPNYKKTREHLAAMRSQAR